MCEGDNPWECDPVSNDGCEAGFACQFGSSDGLFNLGSALSFAQALPHGVYVAMNGRWFPWDDVTKNRSLGAESLQVRRVIRGAWRELQVETRAQPPERERPRELVRPHP